MTWMGIVLTHCPPFRVGRPERRLDLLPGAGVMGAQEGAGGGGDTISHSLTVVQRLEALLLQGNGSDVSLRVETPSADEVKVMQAHSLVLSLQSPVFEEMLLSRNGSLLVLKESADCAAVFDKFIR